MPACSTSQLVVVRTGVTTLTFKDKHATWAKKCVGDPCEVGVHAEVRAIIHFAQSTWSMSQAVLTLKNIPCLSCARMLCNLQIMKIDFKRAAENEEEQKSWEMLAPKVHIDVVRPKSARLGEKASPSTPKDKKAADLDEGASDA